MIKSRTGCQLALRDDEVVVLRLEDGRSIEVQAFRDEQRGGRVGMAIRAPRTIGIFRPGHVSFDQPATTPAPADDGDDATPVLAFARVSTINPRTGQIDVYTLTLTADSDDPAVTGELSPPWRPVWLRGWERDLLDRLVDSIQPATEGRIEDRRSGTGAPLQPEQQEV